VAIANVMEKLTVAVHPLIWSSRGLTPTFAKEAGLATGLWEPLIA